MADQTEKNGSGINLKYLAIVSVLTFLLPAICTVAQIFMMQNATFTFALFGKWFIFSAVGVRLFLAGLKQTTDPAFTAREIFHIDSSESLPIVRELGFANLCFGIVGIISLFLPQWRVVSAFGSGLYFGIAGLQHLIKGAVGINEMFAMATDILICIFLSVYFVTMV